MEIPKQPLKSDLHANVKVTGEATRQIVSDLDALKLEPGKVYQATVEAKPHSINPSSNTSSAQTNVNLSPELKNLTLAEKEWLISVKGQLVLIQSDKILEAGQKLLVQLTQDSNTKQRSLAAQLIEKPQAVVSQNQSLAGTASAKLSANLLPILMQALATSLDKQIPLDDGFKQLQQVLQQTTNTSKLAPLNQLLQTQLFGSLPKLAELLPAPHQAAGTPPSQAFQSLKLSLQNSGLFLEQKLNQTNQTPQINESIRQISEKLLKEVNQLPSSAPSATETSKQSNHSQGSVLQNYAPALQKIQQTIEHILKLSPQQALVKGPDQSLHNDLKANLLIALSALSKQLALVSPHTDIEQFLQASIELDSPLSPFAFPMLPAQKPTSKVLFEKNESATGQVLRLLAGMLNKVQFNQLHSLLQSNQGADNPIQQSWFFELPVMQPGHAVSVFNMRIDKEYDETSHESESPQDKTLVWKLLLSFDLDKLGPIYVQIKLQEDMISSELWADQADTVALLQRESAHFKAQLENLGLQVNDISCKQGQPSQQKTKLDRHLVDTKV